MAQQQETQIVVLVTKFLNAVEAKPADYIDVATEFLNKIKKLAITPTSGTTIMRQDVDPNKIFEQQNNAGLAVTYIIAKLYDKADPAYATGFPCGYKVVSEVETSPSSNLKAGKEKLYMYALIACNIVARFVKTMDDIEFKVISDFNKKAVSDHISHDILVWLASGMCGADKDKVLELMRQAYKQ